MVRQTIAPAGAKRNETEFLFLSTSMGFPRTWGPKKTISITIIE